jgi:hypothetical protein
MFNLLVKAQSWGDGRDTMLASRAFDYAEKSLVDRFKPGGQLDLVALAALPTIFVRETYGENQVARVGAITRARMNGRGIALDYTYDHGIPPVPNKIFQEFAADLGIEDFQFSRTHWSVKDADLYRALLRNSQSRRPRPRVFQLAAYENIEPSLLSAMMPFDSGFDAVYATLRATAEAACLRCVRADDIWVNPAVIQDCPDPGGEWRLSDRPTPRSVCEGRQLLG